MPAEVLAALAARRQAIDAQLAAVSRAMAARAQVVAAVDGSRQAVLAAPSSSVPPAVPPWVPAAAPPSSPALVALDRSRQVALQRSGADANAFAAPASPAMLASMSPTFFPPPGAGALAPAGVPLSVALLRAAGGGASGAASPAGSPAPKSAPRTPATAAAATPDPIARSEDLLRRSAAVHGDAMTVSSVRDALASRLVAENADCARLRAVLGRTTSELADAHAALSARTREVESLRGQLDRMVALTSQLLSTLDPAAMGALTVASARVAGDASAAAAAMPSMSPTPLMPLTASVAAATPPHAGEYAYRPLPAATPAADPVPSPPGAGAGAPPRRPTADANLGSFATVMAAFDSWARDHDAVVAMLHALPAHAGQ